MRRAPEQVDAEVGSRGTHTDVWGFATTMLHLATGQLPYAGLTQVQMVSAVLKQRPPAVPDTLPAWLGQILRQCLTFDIAQRPRVPQLLEVIATSCMYTAQAKMKMVHNVLHNDVAELSCTAAILRWLLPTNPC